MLINNNLPRNHVIAYTNCTCFLSAAEHVGPPVPYNIVKLVDVEEKEYYYIKMVRER